MGALFAFLVGWMVGARAGKQGYDEVVQAAKEVLGSDEVALLKVAVRRHAAFTLGQLSEWLQESEQPGGLVDDAIVRIRRLVQAPTAGRSG